MTSPIDPDQLTRIRDAARRLADHAGKHEEQLGSLVVSAKAEVRRAEAALSRTMDLTQDCVDHLLTALRVQLMRRKDEVEVARQLCVDAREHHAAAVQMVSDLGSPDVDNARAPGRMPRPTVLVADDHEDTREMVALVLHNAGFVVRTASNGLEALIAAYEMRPAVIVMDMTMPVLDGLEATRLIKAFDATQHARIIAYTAAPDLRDLPTRKLFAAVLPKPSPPDIVVATVQQYVGA